LQDEKGRAIEIESLRATSKALIARIKGVTTREAAEALVRTKLYVARAMLPAREEEEWYHADLIGLAALGQDGAALGQVVAIHNFGAGDLLEVKPTSGGATVLLPFTRDTVPEIDVEGGRLTLAPPEGLFE
jgi:16S rRNA processing protein RimM